MIHFANTYQRLDQVEAAVVYFGKLGFNVDVDGFVVYAYTGTPPCATCGTGRATIQRTGGGHNYWLCEDHAAAFWLSTDSYSVESNSAKYAPNFPLRHGGPSIEGFSFSEVGNNIDLNQWGEDIKAWATDLARDRARIVAYIEHGWNISALNDALKSCGVKP